MIILPCGQKYWGKKTMKVVKNNSFQSKIKDLIMSYNNSEYGNRFFNEIISSDIFIYGAGNAGRMTYELLQN